MAVDGESVRRLRTERALSLSDLEAASGVSRETILAIEQGKRNPHPGTIRKLAEALGVEPRELLSRDNLGSV